MHLLSGVISSSRELFLLYLSLFLFVTLTGGRKMRTVIIYSLVDFVSSGLEKWPYSIAQVYTASRWTKLARLNLWVGCKIEQAEVFCDLGRNELEG